MSNIFLTFFNLLSGLAYLGYYRAGRYLLRILQNLQMLIYKYLKVLIIM
jgi:hypothetical protein